MCLRLVLALLCSAHLCWAVAPPRAVNTDQVRAWLVELDDDDFEIRQRADEQLRSLGKAVVPTLKQELSRTKSYEVKARLGRMIHDLTLDERIETMVRQLADQDAATRARAAWELRRAGALAVPLLREQMKGNMPKQVREQVETMLTELSRHK